jgi:hypothetical protein
MTKTPKPSKPRPSDVIEINPTITAPFKWNVFRVGSPTLVVNAKILIVTADGALDFRDDVGGVVNLTIFAVPPGGYSYVTKT